MRLKDQKSNGWDRILPLLASGPAWKTSPDQALRAILDNHAPPFMQCPASAFAKMDNGAINTILKNYGSNMIPVNGLVPGTVEGHHFMGFPSNTMGIPNAAVVGTPAISDLSRCPAVVSEAFKMACDKRGEPLDAEMLEAYHNHVVKEAYLTYMRSLERTEQPQGPMDNFRLRRSVNSNASVFGCEYSRHIKATYVQILPQNQYDQAGSQTSLHRPRRSSDAVDLVGSVVIHELAEGCTFGHPDFDSNPKDKRFLVVVYLPLKEQISDATESRQRYLRLCSYAAHNLYASLSQWNVASQAPWPVCDLWMLNPTERILDMVSDKDAEGRLKATQRYFKDRCRRLREGLEELQDTFTEMASVARHANLTRQEAKEMKKVEALIRKRRRQIGKYKKFANRESEGVATTPIQGICYARAGLESDDFWTFGPTEQFQAAGNKRTALEYIAAWWRGASMLDKSLQQYAPAVETHAEGCAVGSRLTKQAQMLNDKYKVKFENISVPGILAVNQGVQALKAAAQRKK
ncbi:MAG: uncharacterized protein KVP18_002192 [Porospora cf. gigantea A]|uniref:uncharacterized protein n=1 Tax=Porospora cf. gigantea A TaxID=2853593 RepID=UPI003559FBB2|nr:MAG: hypothetical protein KVP18_002192 [Porospora cf. gigantea A]